MKIFIGIFFVFLLCSCSGQAINSNIEFLPPADCENLYVLLPENFIIDMAAGSEVFINPAAYEFILFCSSEEAIRARQKALTNGLLSANSGWRIYRLEGLPKDIAEYCHKRALCLKQSAKVIDWIEEN